MDELSLQTRRCSFGVAALHNHSLLVRGQAVDDEVSGLNALMYHFFEELYEQLGSLRTLVGLKPEGAFGIDRRGGSDALVLAGSIHTVVRPRWPLVLPCTRSARKPDSSQKITSAPSRHARAAMPRVGHVSLPLNGLWIALVGVLQRLLRRQSWETI